MDHLKKAQHALKTGVFKWSKDYDEAAYQYEQAAKAFKEVSDEEAAAEAYLEFAKCSEHQKAFHQAGDGYAECARLLPDSKWKQSWQCLKQADVYYKMCGYEDRGFTAMKKFTQNLSDGGNQESIDASLFLYSELWPMLFEGEMMTMNYDMMESYTKLLAKQAKWTVLLEAKYRQIKYWRDTKAVDHRSRRAFLEIICIQIIIEDIYKLEQTLDNFCKEVGGNPYVHDEYEICVGIKEALEKKDWENM